MTTLSEALAALDEVTCGLPTCRFRDGANGADPLSETGCLCLHPYRLQARRNAAIRTVIQAARARVAEDERAAKEAEERELRERAERDFRDYWGKR
jgi:hypothetical protein